MSKMIISSKKIILVSLLIVAFGVMLFPTPVAAAWDEYVTYTADDYDNEGTEDYCWLHTEVTIKYHYVLIRGVPRLTSVTWYKFEHTTRIWNGVAWVPWNMDVSLNIIQDDEYFWWASSPWPTDYFVKYPGVPAKSGDIAVDTGINPLSYLQTQITITV